MAKEEIKSKNNRIKIIKQKTIYNPKRKLRNKANKRLKIVNKNKNKKSRKN